MLFFTSKAEKRAAVERMFARKEFQYTDIYSGQTVKGTVGDFFTVEYDNDKYIEATVKTKDTPLEKLDWITNPSETIASAVQAFAENRITAPLDTPYMRLTVSLHGHDSNLSRLAHRLVTMVRVYMHPINNAVLEKGIRIHMCSEMDEEEIKYVDVTPEQAETLLNLVAEKCSETETAYLQRYHDYVIKQFADSGPLMYKGLYFEAETLSIDADHPQRSLRPFHYKVAEFMKEDEVAKRTEKLSIVKEMREERRRLNEERKKDGPKQVFCSTPTDGDSLFERRGIFNYQHEYPRW